MQTRRPFGGPLSALRPWAPLVVAALLLVLAATADRRADAPGAARGRHRPADPRRRRLRADRVGSPPGTGRAADGVAHRRARPLWAARRRGRYARRRSSSVRTGRSPRADSTAITGHLTGAIVAVEEDLPLEATVFGAPPAIVPHLVVQLDEAALPERVTWWPLSILPVLLAVALIVGAWAGYPVFRPTSEVDVVSSPLAPGERVPAAFAGRLGPTVRDLSDPGAALIVVRPGPAGNVLTAQPLPDDDRPAPPPVPIGGRMVARPHRLGVHGVRGGAGPQAASRERRRHAPLREDRRT